MSKEQSLIHLRQVHLVMDTLDKDGVDIKCLSWKKGMKIWEDFCDPHLKNKSESGNTIKTYLKSLNEEPDSSLRRENSTTLTI